MKKAVVSGALSDCEWCGEVVAGCKPTPDKQEGPYGDLYNVCRECREKEDPPLQDWEPLFLELFLEKE